MGLLRCNKFHLRLTAATRFYLRLFYLTHQSAFASVRSGCFVAATMLFHNVYFWLKPELTPAQRAEFRRGVETLKGIKSVEKVSIGVPAGTTKRPVIDHSYDVALIVECRDVAAEAAYQIDPIHLTFVESCKHLWTRVQIYDSQ
jgi:Stress responsive A/B Barrel Domain